ncbi:MAG: GTP-binding protein [Caldilineales bacterium]|nr:GTP-binding protein [Caldilineales bacterium]
MTSSPIPVTILAGFLGAGKTTLLNRILRAEHGLRVAVLINDFGEINIDSQLIEGDRTSDMISLPNGCICCTLFGNLVEVLLRFARLDTPPDHILIEASGVSQPHQIIDILKVSELQKRLRLDGVITLVDAENVRRLAEVVMFIEGQLADADLIVLNKMDLIDAVAAGELQDWIRQIAPDVTIFPTTFADVPLPLLLDLDPVAEPDEIAGQESALHDHADHGLAFETWTHTSDQPVPRDALLQMLEALPSSVYRVKGFVNLIDSPLQRTVVQVVGKRIHLDEDGVWGDVTPRTELVFIGAPGASAETPSVTLA